MEESKRAQRKPLNQKRRQRKKLESHVKVLDAAKGKKLLKKPQNKTTKSTRKNKSLLTSQRRDLSEQHTCRKWRTVSWVVWEGVINPVQ